MEKETKKAPIGIIICIIIIVILLAVGGVFGYKGYKEIQDLKAANTSLQQQIDGKTKDEQAAKAEVEKAAGEISAEQSKLVIPSLFTSTAKKVQTAPDGIDYTLSLADYSNRFYIEIKDGVAYAHTYYAKDELAKQGLDTSKAKLTNSIDPISGFSKKVVDACMVFDQNKTTNMCYLFLMEDGTVEYSTIQNMVDNISTQGAISGLSNIVSIQKVKVADPTTSEMSAIAIDKDNNYYDVSTFITK